MAVVKMHQASDGSVHLTFELFSKHEEKLKIVKAIKDAGLDTTDFDSANDGRGMDFDDIEAFIVTNADKLRNILNGAVVSKRGRKSAVAA